MCTVTVFTPTYNRAHMLPKLFESLNGQTSHDFEWLVVDDGSTDNTGPLLEEYLRAETPFAIRTITVANGGKHRAINKGVAMARGELFFIVDADDYLDADAIATIVHHHTLLRGRHMYGGIIANRRSPRGDEPNCGDGEFADTTWIARNQAGPVGEKAEAYLTEVLRRYPFPEFDGETFIPEGVVWDRIAADGYWARWINRPIYNFDYYPDGLTARRIALYRENPRGFLTFASQEMRLHGRGRLQCLSQCGLFIKYTRGALPRQEIRRLLNISALTCVIAPAFHSLKKLIGYHHRR